MVPLFLQAADGKALTKEPSEQIGAFAVLPNVCGFRDAAVGGAQGNPALEWGGSSTS